MTVALMFLAVLLVIAAAAPRYGVDSRNGIDARRSSPSADLRAVARALSRRGTHRVR